MSPVYIVTGGAGFIGSNLVHYLLSERPDATVVVYDCLTYAGNLDNLEGLIDSKRCHFVEANICDGEQVRRALETYRPTVVFNLAAESHVDRSIDGPAAFVQTNVMGTFEMLDGARRYFESLDDGQQQGFRFVHVSTDEVYGALGAEGKFCETTAYAPNSPYAASKAGADHLARAYYETYGLPTLTTNCSNNYGPYQFPEKLIPVVILNALDGKPLPVYGTGQNVRDWIFVLDHCAALLRVAERGQPGQTYNIGADEERTTLQMVHGVCDAMDRLVPCSERAATAALGTHRDLIEFVKDRPGHDWRYAIDATKIHSELDWKPAASFDAGIEQTVQWYLDHAAWCARIADGGYRRERLGLDR